MSHPASHSWEKYMECVHNLLSFQKGKEILTDNNIPHGQCVICLYGFQVGFSAGAGVSLGRQGRASEWALIQNSASVSLQEKEAFTKTPCYHYFHCHCLARYIQHMEQELKTQGQEQERQHVVTKQVDIARPAFSLGTLILHICLHPSILVAFCHLVIDTFEAESHPYPERHP